MAADGRGSTIRQIWPLLTVQNLERSLDFYERALGFSVVGRADIGGRAFWCRLERGGASLMLQQSDDEDGPVDGRGRGVALYVVCDDVERLRAEFTSRGLQLPPVSIAEYGMKQFVVSEPDGYSLCFESPTETWTG
ncbi:MAG: VOC family protein [Vicinamibacterales bacterium]